MTNATSLKCLYLGLVALVLSNLMVIGVVDPAGLLGVTMVETASAERMLATDAPVRYEGAPQRTLSMTAVDVSVPTATASVVGSNSGGVEVDVSDFVPPPPPLEPATELAPSVVAELVPVPTPVPSPTPTPSPTPIPSPKSKAEAAFTSLDFDLEEFGYEISFEEPKHGYLGLTLTTERVVEIYARPSLSTDELRFVIAHELGHVVDHMRNDSGHRAEWRETREFPEVASWWPTGPGSDHGTAAGDFAECFATWLTGLVSHHVQDCEGTDAAIEAALARDNVRSMTPTV